MDELRTGPSAIKPVFVSYATADRKEALSVCKALEKRGIKCWISTRDVAPGENYQEAIVRSVRDAHAMVLVFSGAANNSDEIKKELSLASRYHLPVMALRIEDVEPSDAFAYELSTRQWVDAFDGWEGSIDSLSRRIAEIQGPGVPGSPALVHAGRRRASKTRHLRVFIAAAAILLLVAAATTWRLLLRPPAAHSMMVRLAGFQQLSNNLPAGTPDAIRDEIIAAFNDDGVVGVSTASAPQVGKAPAYALAGTIRRDGDQIRVISRLTNERSGATLWSGTFDYGADQLSRLPRRIAVDAGNIVRCGLYGASTYRRSLPDPVLTDYLQFCQNSADFQQEPGKALNFARKVVVQAPDFSWGWSAVALASAQAVAWGGASSDNELRDQGVRAADKALALDPSNSEALAQKSLLIDPTNRVGQERLLKQAIAAKPLDCGCEHFLYGVALENVGRLAAAIKELRRGTDMLALNANSQLVLADALIAVGKADEAKPHLEASIELAPGPSFRNSIALLEATETRDYAAAIKALADPKLEMPAARRAALLTGFQALVSRDQGAKARAVTALAGLPEGDNSYVVVKLLAALGANHDAFEVFVAGINSSFDWPSLLWYPSMRGVLSEPGFPAVAQRLGLVNYWKTTQTKPDVCLKNAPPPFCGMI